MKKLYLLLLFASQCAFAAPIAGSDEAAKALIPEYLGGLFTIVDALVVKGDTATVNARILDQSCVLTLLKNSTANSSGWVVSKQSCKKI